MAMFNSYVSLPEGTLTISHGEILIKQRDFSAFSASRHSCNSSPAEDRHRAPDDCGCTNCGSSCRLDPTWNKKAAAGDEIGIGLIGFFWTENHGIFGVFFVFFLGFYGFLPSTTKGFLWLFSPKSGWIHSAHYQPSPYVYGICGLTWNFACIKIPMSHNSSEIWSPVFFNYINYLFILHDYIYIYTQHICIYIINIIIIITIIIIIIHTYIYIYTYVSVCMRQYYPIVYALYPVIYGLRLSWIWVKK